MIAELMTLQRVDLSVRPLPWRECYSILDTPTYKGVDWYSVWAKVPADGGFCVEK